MANLLRYCVFGLLLVPSLSFAQRTIVVEPGQVTRMFEPGQGAHAYFDSRNWNQPVSTQQGTINVPVKASRGLSWANFRARAASMLKLNPSSVAGGAAVTAALAAVDWLLDPANNSLRREEFPPVNTDEFFWCVNINTSGCSTSGSLTNGPWPSPESWLDARIASTPSYYLDSYTITDLDPSRIRINWTSRSVANNSPVSYNSTLYRHGICPTGSSYNTSTRVCHSQTPQLIPVTPVEIDGLVSGWSDPALPLEMAPSLQVPLDAYDPDIFTGPASMPGPTSSTTTTTPSGDTVVSQDSITYDFSYSNNPLSITTNTTTVNNTYQNGVQTSTSTTTTNNTNTNTGSNVQLPDIPTDCEFMPTVCEWLDWTKEDLNEPDPDLSGLLNDEDFDRDFSIPLSATCPPPYAINTQLFGTVYFQWEPLCLFAEYIRYLVVSGAILFAMYISLGIQRKG